MKRIAILSLFVLALPSVTQAHHIRGIPHYSYQDHYPETPVYEVDQVVDAYDVTFTYYEIPGQMALDLAMYIRDTLPEPTPYEGPVNFLVWGRHEDPDQMHPFTAFRNATNVYKVGWVYEDAGAMCAFSATKAPTANGLTLSYSKKANYANSTITKTATRFPKA